MRERMTRRQALGAAGAAGAALVTARSGLLGRLTATEPAAAASCATLTPSMTEGPYWIDELLKRSDVRSSTSGGAVQPGVPLKLRIVVQDAANGCAPVKGAHVDIWHANAYGRYSDEAQQPGGSTKGQDFLRGYQVTDAGGAVDFTTIWPGWYAGRTIHIHVRVRTYGAGGAVATDYTTQIFFEESDNTAVLTGAAPYNGRSPQLDPTRNANDSILGANGATNTLAASGTVAGGYSGTFTIRLQTGSTVDRPAGADASVAASVTSAKVVRATGKRTLVVGYSASEPLTVRARLIRGATTLGQATGKVDAGTHALRVAVPAATAAGKATAVVTLADAAGNTRTLRRTVTVPARAG